MAKARVLAVDDQRYFRELIAGMLVEEGYEAETAPSGEEALRILETADFDLVLTDLVMPGMDGTELVHRIRARDPEQEVVVVTGVVDVKTAVDAMKLGANDYLLKPFDRRTLATTIDTVLQNRRLKNEHARLLAENIEYMGERSLYERALALFSTLSIDALAMRIAESLAIETRAQGVVVWLAPREDAPDYELAAARGIVRMADEPERVRAGEAPEALTPEVRATLAPWGDGEGQEALWASLMRDDEIVGLVRLTDKLEGDRFDAVDVACVDKFVQFGDTAVANAMRVRGLERHGLREPGTGAYNVDYFRNVARNEIEKANRFGRSFALVTLDFGTPEDLARIAVGEDLQIWLRALTEHVDRMLRSTDLLAVSDDRRFSMLLPEADALGAAVFKRRMLAALAEAELVTSLPEAVRPTPRAGVAIYPGDGAQLESLIAASERRIADERESPVATLGLAQLPLVAGLRELARQGQPETRGMAEQLTRFAISEVARRPRERGLLYAVPGAGLDQAVREGLEALRDVPVRTDLVVLAGGEAPSLGQHPVSWVSPDQVPADIPACLVHFGDGPAYALVRDTQGDGPPRLFHTSDRGLVEHLAFRLHEDLGIPATLGEEALQ